MPRERVEPAPSRCAAGVIAAVIGLLAMWFVEFVVGYALLIAVGNPIAFLVAGVLSWTAGGVTAAWIYTRSVDGPIQWSAKKARNT
jgi:hypothetical protein